MWPRRNRPSSCWRESLPCENLVLAAMGGGAGCAFAILLIRTIPHIPRFCLPRADEIQPDVRMLFTAVAVTITSGLLFGVALAWSASVPPPRTARRHCSGGRSHPYRCPRPACTDRAATRDVAHTVIRGRLIAQQLHPSHDRQHRIQQSRCNSCWRPPSIQEVQLRTRHPLLRAAMEEIRTLPGVLDASAADYLPLLAVRMPYQISPAGRATTGIEGHGASRGARIFSRAWHPDQGRPRVSAR